MSNSQCECAYMHALCKFHSKWHSVLDNTCLAFSSSPSYTHTLTCSCTHTYTHTHTHMYTYTHYCTFLSCYTLSIWLESFMILLASICVQLPPLLLYHVCMCLAEDCALCLQTHLLSALTRWSMSPPLSSLKLWEHTSLWNSLWTYYDLYTRAIPFELS